MILEIKYYSFGRMIIGTKEYTSDLILDMEGHIQDNWWRKQGHYLSPEDIAAVLESAPKKIVIGTGANGRMAVSDQVIQVCQKKGIELEILPTAEAVTHFNCAVQAGIPVAGCFHLTC